MQAAELTVDTVHVGLFLAATTVLVTGLISLVIRSDRRARARTDRFDLLIAEMSDAVIVRDATGRVLWGSASVARVFGYERNEMVGSSVIDLIHPDDVRAAVEAMAENSVRPGTGVTARMRARHKDGRWIDIEAVATNLLDDPLVNGVVINLRDVTETIRREHALQRYQLAFEHAPGAMALLDADGRIVEANVPMHELLGVDAVVGLDALTGFEAPGRRSTDEVLRWDQVIPPVPADAATTGGAEGDGERTLHHRITPVGRAGDVGGYLLETEDITDRVRSHDELEWKASHDLLTGLSNRAGLTAHLKDTFAKAADERSLGVLLIDLDGFKAVNDHLGHQAGDHVLVAVADRLRAAARGSDLVVRLGGDEFVVVAHDLRPSSLKTLVSRIERAIADPIGLPDGTTSVGASVGACMADPSDTPDTVVARADQAMYEAKAARRRRAAAGAQHRGAPRAANEDQRLAALRSLDLLDSAPDPRVDAICRLAAEVCGTPMAAVSLVDDTRQWFKSSVGIDVAQTPREDAFCGHTILQPGIFTVPDAATDDRFRANPLVVGDAEVRFYAGAPLEVEPGLAVGALCVIDREPRHLSDAQQALLADLSLLLVDVLVQPADPVDEAPADPRRDAWAGAHR